ncbi:MAG: outer membrane beta-barrel protein [Ignavibacteriae bacterium]|nr:outer membrane beta-barrel protein [Ignavibacteriota bacterium]
MLKYGSVACAVVALLLLVASPHAQAQPVKWSVGGNMGLSIASNTYATSAGFHFGPMAEVIFNRQLAVGTEFNINTQAGTPIEWATYFKYYIDAKTVKIKPYVDAGFGLLFLTGGPYFGIRFGGGVGFMVGKNLYVGPDLQLGPIFTTGVSTFYIAIRGGLRYEIP